MCLVAESLMSLHNLSVPFTYILGVNASDAHEWRRAMNDEMKSLNTNKVWKLVNLPDGMSPICTK